MKAAAYIRKATTSEPAALAVTIALTIEISDLNNKALVNRAGRRISRLICEFGGTYEEQEKAKEELVDTLKQAARLARLKVDETKSTKAS